MAKKVCVAPVRDRPAIEWAKFCNALAVNAAIPSEASREKARGPRVRTLLDR